MHTIALVAQKGGSGKSTLATSLALAARQAGHTVCLLDTDPLGTLTKWQRRRGPVMPLVETVLNAREIEQRLQALESRGVTVAIVDTPSGVSAASTAAIRYSDLCMIPARPSIADIEASALTLNVVRAWKKTFAFILNQTPIRGNRIGSAAATLSDDAGFDLADVVAKPFIVMRNDHQDALAAFGVRPSRKQQLVSERKLEFVVRQFDGRAITNGHQGDAQQPVVMTVWTSREIADRYRSRHPLRYIEQPGRIGAPDGNAPEARGFDTHQRP